MKRRGCRRPKSSYGTTPDGAVFSLLHRIGSDISKPCPTNFYLYFYSQSNANSAASELIAAGFSVVVDKSADDRNWLCLASKEMIPQAITLVSLRNKFSDLVGRFGGEYDGWETEVNSEEGKEGS